MTKKRSRAKQQAKVATGAEPTRAAAAAVEGPTPRELFRSAIAMTVVAFVVLIVAVLPAEYAIDPTGIGRLLGLTQMGEVKQRLAHENEEHAAAPDDAPPAVATSLATTAASTPPAGPAPAASEAPVEKSDRTTVTLDPQKATEVKLHMAAGAKASFEWKVDGGAVNYDLHADKPGGAYHGYAKGKDSRGEAGELTAAFDGWHGWFWRNRSSEPVTITLETRGDYREVKQMK